MKARIVIASGLLALCLGATSIGHYSALPSLEGRTASTAVFNTEDTRLGRVISPMVAAHPGLSGVYTLPDARDAFAARSLLAQTAERTLDIRYYIWRGDVSGTLLLDAVRAAADRGVRVRLLLDDNNTTGLDPLLAALDSHPNIEVRLFNPFAIRAPRWVGYITDFFRLNRRMHDKSFTADNQAAIVGGRNVGDEYFGTTDGMLFADLDVLAIGPVVTEVSKDFDRYWASASSYPAERLLPAADSAQMVRLANDALQVKRDAATIAYVNALHDSTFVRDWNQKSLVPLWAATRMISDDPAKGLGRVARETLMFQKVRKIIGESTMQVDLVSPYFVPTAEGVDILVDLAKRGVKIRILTNALEATDVAVVHAGYAKWRKTLLQNGIELYELRRTSPDLETTRSAGRFSSSSASLHAKLFSVDRSRVFIGSFNFDPRSVELNSEMGVVIDSPALGHRVDTALTARIASGAYKVRLSDEGHLYWLERRGLEWVRYDTEPGTDAWQRTRVSLLSMLPVEWLL